MKKIFFLFIILSLFSCKHIIKEVVLKYNDNSPKLIHYYKIVDDKKILVSETAFYPNKNKLMEGEYKNNQRNGKWTSWYENGNKWSEAIYDSDIRNGINTTWYENSKKRYEGNYSKGIKTGVWKFWNENGQLINQMDFDKNN